MNAKTVETINDNNTAVRVRCNSVELLQAVKAAKLSMCDDPTQPSLNSVMFSVEWDRLRVQGTDRYTAVTTVVESAEITGGDNGQHVFVPADAVSVIESALTGAQYDAVLAFDYERDTLTVDSVTGEFGHYEVECHPMPMPGDFIDRLYQCYDGPASVQNVTLSSWKLSRAAGAAMVANPQRGSRVMMQPSSNPRAGYMVRGYGAGYALIMPLRGGQCLQVKPLPDKNIAGTKIEGCKDFVYGLRRVLKFKAAKRDKDPAGELVHLVVDGGHVYALIVGKERAIRFRLMGTSGDTYQYSGHATLTAVEVKRLINTIKKAPVGYTAIAINSDVVTVQILRQRYTFPTVGDSAMKAWTEFETQYARQRVEWEAVLLAARDVKQLTAGCTGSYGKEQALDLTFARDRVFFSTADSDGFGVEAGYVPAIYAGTLKDCPPVSGEITTANSGVETVDVTVAEVKPESRQITANSQENKGVNAAKSVTVADATKHSEHVNSAKRASAVSDTREAALSPARNVKPAKYDKQSVKPTSDTTETTDHENTTTTTTSEENTDMSTNTNATNAKTTAKRNTKAKAGKADKPKRPDRRTVCGTREFTAVLLRLMREAGAEQATIKVTARDQQTTNVKVYVAGEFGEGWLETVAEGACRDRVGIVSLDTLAEAHKAARRDAKSGSPSELYHPWLTMQSRRVGYIPLAGKHGAVVPTVKDKDFKATEQGFAFGDMLERFMRADADYMVSADKRHAVNVATRSTKVRFQTFAA